LKSASYKTIKESKNPLENSDEHKETKEGIVDLETELAKALEEIDTLKLTNERNQMKFMNLRLDYKRNKTTSIT